MFQRDKSTISRHIRNIFTEGDLDEKVVVAEFATTTQYGAMKGKMQSNITRFYNLDVVIYVAYRVKSQCGVQFRIWATSNFKEYIKKVLRWTMIVSEYLDFAERQAEREIPMTLEVWAKYLDDILTSTGKNLLNRCYLNHPGLPNSSKYSTFIGCKEILYICNLIYPKFLDNWIWSVQGKAMSRRWE